MNDSQPSTSIVGTWSGVAAPVGILLLIVLLRPVIDTTWYWKKTELGISPLQVVGLLLPVFLLWSLWRKRVVLDGLLRRHAEVVAWTILSFFSGLAVFSDMPVAAATGVLVKFVLPGLFLVFGMLYLRERSLMDRLALFMVLAAVLPLLFVVYELLFGPMSVSTRSGILRYCGPYAQVSVYGIYFSMGLLGAGYLALRQGNIRWFILLSVFVAVMGFSSAWVVHLTTWAVLGGLLVVMIIALLWRREWWKAISLLLLAIVVTASGFLLRPDSNYEKIVGPDLAVIRGDAPLEHYGNSRGKIWKKYLKQYSALPLHAQLLGIPFAAESETSGTGFGAHNDFLRILMATGAVGLLLYLLWLGRTVRAIFRLRGELLFLGVGALIIWLGFSVGLTPTYIVPLSTVLLPVLGGMSEISRRERKATTRLRTSA